MLSNPAGKVYQWYVVNPYLLSIGRINETKSKQKQDVQNKYTTKLLEDNTKTKKIL